MRKDELSRAAKKAALVSALVTLGVVANGAIGRPHKHAPAPPPISLPMLVIPAVVCFALVFLIFFVWNLWSIARAEPVNEILEMEAPESERLKTPLYAFVAMEYYALILNRTCAIFVAPEGLYGWTAVGVVTNSDRRFYEPLQDLVADPDMASDLPAIRKLAALRGGFFYPSAEIVAVSSDEKSQWGMGGILTLGHVEVRIRSGKRRRFILLGNTIPEEVRDRIAATLGVQLPSTE
jgi:hypothetical protein